MGEYHDKFLRLATMILGHFRHIRILSNSNIWNQFVDLFIRLFWGFKYGSSKKKRLQGSTINNDLCEKLDGVKTMGLLECQHATSSPGRKQTWFSVVHSFQVFKYCWYFLIVFSSRHCLYIKGRFFIKRWNVFWRCSCGNRYSFTKSKRKHIVEN